MNRNRFTLLEVLVALVILSIGVTGLLWQLSVASERAFRNTEAWENTHNLINAAEHLLLHGTGAGLDTTLFRGNGEISYRYEIPAFPDGGEIVEGRKQLRTLVIEVSRNGELLDSIRIDCWVGESDDER